MRTFIRTFLATLVLSVSLSSTAVASEGNDGKVTIAVSPSPQETLPGGNISFTLSVHNHDRHTLSDLDVSILFDREILSIVETLPSGGSFAREGIALWNIDELYAGKTWSVQFPVHVENYVRAGSSTEVIARVSGSDVNIANSTVMDSVTVGAAILPPTGGRTDVIASIALMMGAMMLIVVQRQFADR